MDRLHCIEIFIAVAEAESFATAADRMALPRSTVTRSVKALETHLGTELIRRSTRRFHLTEDGALYLERARPLLAEFAEVEGALSSASKRPRGTVRVNTTASIAEHLLVPLLPLFHADYSDIAVRLSVTDRVIDLIGSGVDCVIRAGGFPEDSPSVTARTLGHFRWGFYASPGYLKMFGELDGLDNLKRHRFVGYEGGGREFLDILHEGSDVRLPLNSWLTVNDTASYVEAAVQGIGIIRAADFIVERQVVAGSLCPTLESADQDTTQISLIHSRTIFPSMALRSFRAWMVKHFEQVNPRVGQ